MSLDFSPLLCTYCQSLADTVCSRCYEPYCNWKCQAKDWAKHKYVCKSVPALGKIYILLAKCMQSQKIWPTYSSYLNKTKNDEASLVAPKKIYRLHDLHVIPLRRGNRSFVVTDTSQLKNYQIAIIDCENSKRSDFYFTKLASYCEEASNQRKDYEPTVSELCLAIFDGDGMWYRAYCIEGPKRGKFMLQFVDFGNVALVSSKNIMPINEELMFPSSTHLCFVTNIQRTHIKKFRIYIECTPKLKGYIRYNKFDGIYEITISKLERILR